MQKLMKYFDKKNLEYEYVGPSEFNKDDDYPDFIKPACKLVLENEENCGIFMCGSGAGANMVANRFKGIRAICASDPVEAFFARKDEDANVLTIGSRFVSFRKAIKIIQTFLTSEFEGGRHARRIAKY
jgi:ribose 5-phosphate isomerase B